MNAPRNLLQESLSAIERLQARLEATERAKREPIAIIGAACRYPGGATDPEGLWRVARDGINGVCDVPPDRWDVAAYYDPVPGTPGKMHCAKGGFLPDIDQFDAQFFGISPREAAYMDPQQRMVLETSQEALEAAGLATGMLAGSKTGVFVGITTTDYGNLVRARGLEQSDVYSANGSALSTAAGRVAFTFGFLGPCAAIDTACSSSLVAVHLACQSLRTGESNLALVGGVNAILDPSGTVVLSQWGLMALDGACKTFDARADGFVRSEGCGMIVLKRLADAQRDGDPILAVIRGSAVNTNGHGSALTVPHGPAQEELVRAALANAGLQAVDIDYVEAFGTGTAIGDPIEVGALAAVMGEGRPVDRPLIIGSIKPNIGHPECASGLAGLLKAVMALRHEAIPPNIHFETPNPRVPWDDLPIKVADKLLPWPRSSRPRRAGVSGFGFSGTNAHVIVEEAPQADRPDEPVAIPALIPISGFDQAALKELAGRYADRIAAAPDLSLGDIVATLGAGRTHMRHRLALLTESKAEFERDLRIVANGGSPISAAEGTIRETPKVAFLFTGEGSQYAAMGKEIYASEPVFKAVLDRAAAVLDPLLERPFLDVIFAKDAARLNEPAYAQPALFALEYALAELWRAWGVRPSVVVGHGVGEFAAACVAGVFSFEDGLKLTAERGRLMQALPAGGAMAVVFADEARVAAAIAQFSDRLAIAAINGPQETVLSGDAQTLAKVLAALQADGIDSRPLEVSHALHSPLIDPMLAGLESFARKIPHRAPDIPLVSNVTGTLFAPGTHPDAAYWRRHARQAVRFAASVQTLRNLGLAALVEVGPHPTQLALVSQAAPDAAWATIGSLRKGGTDRREMLAAARDLYVRGADLDWGALSKVGSGRRVAMPTYPFQRQRYWLDPVSTRRKATSAGHPLLGERQTAPGPATGFLAELATDSPSFLAANLLSGSNTMPFSGYMEMALAAGDELGMKDVVGLENLQIETPLEFAKTDVWHVHTAVTPDGPDSYSLVVRSASASDRTVNQLWRVHARATLRARTSTSSHASKTIADMRARCRAEVEVADYYARLEMAGINCGPAAARRLHSFQYGDDCAVGSLQLDSPAQAGAKIVLPAALLDAALQMVGGVLLLNDSKFEQKVFVPVELRELTVNRLASDRLWVAVSIAEVDRDTGFVRADFRFENAAGGLVAAMSGVLLQQTVVVEAPVQASDALAAFHQSGNADPAERLRLLRTCLQEQVARVLGFNPPSMDVDTPLPALGLDSLMAVQLHKQLLSEVKIDFPIVMLVQGPTVTELAVSIFNFDRSERTEGHIVSLKATGSRPPLFCVHGLDGYAQDFARLILYLDAEQPAYGLRPGPLADKLNSNPSLEMLAQAYASAIRKVQPSGPYRVCGYSFGGVAAFEVARQLASSGEDVLVLLIDAFGYPARRNWSFGPLTVVAARRVLHVLNRGRRRVRRVVQLGQKGQLVSHIRKKFGLRLLGQPQIDRDAQIDRQPTSGETRVGDIPKWVIVNRRALALSLWRAYTNHQLQPSWIAGVLFRLSDHRKNLMRDVDGRYGWRGLMRRGLAVVEIDGEHNTIMREPRVVELARKLNEVLAKADATAPARTRFGVGLRGRFGLRTNSIPNA